MSKAEYRYYELPQNLPLLALTGEKWETVYGMDNMHFHNYLEVGYCYYGNGIIQFAEKELPYHAGTLTFIPKNIPHRTCPAPEEHTCKQKWEYLFVDTDMILKKIFADAPEKYAKMQKNLSEEVFVLENDRNATAVNLLQMIIEEVQQKKNNYRYAAFSLAFNFLLFFERLNNGLNRDASGKDYSRSDTMNYIRKIINYMEIHYMEEIKAKDLAGSCGLSETHMRRIFSEYANMSPSEYLNVIRINKACELLAHGSESIEEVARLTGYQVLSTFLRNFKKMTGLSPSAWRKKALQDPQNIASYQISVLKGW